MTNINENLTISAGRDFNRFRVYEYCLFRGEQLIHRATGFATKKAAQRAALKYATSIPA